ncbi:MAG: RNA polymerase sigma factor [Pseudomonadota bacterium]
MSDEQLMLWLQQGDESCLGALFERHHGNLFSFCLHLVKDRAIAEDLVQEAFLRVLGKRRSYRGGSFKAWLYNIARNLAFDHHRRNARSRFQQPDETTPDPVEERDAERVTGARERQARVQDALAALPTAAREVILLGRFEFDNYVDLGAALGCTPGAAKVRLHRAMKALNAMLDQLNPEASHA